ncbi:MFS transporter [Ferrimonas marina]|uniref:Maltose/moltooligosaccharide transporter n=1 Tax=Ferrimonas marina TaxID=299255 RepID=A0A1M5VHC7_9GAMM|nr:MFS transporter [Ferrimonas marina]SHH74637.1 maltose/moltooligosaccharide transporter [Ferrimonas marina]
MVTDKPKLSFWQIWNMCFGFLGIQFAFALQNANVSRIFQTLGADMDLIPILWIAGPVTGLIVQPIVGHFSDKTWGKMGRRRPYFLYGAIVTSLALIAMPNSPYLWFAASMLWIMDAAINVSMQPFRALVGDNLPKSQQPTGFAVQSFFIGVGAVVASMLPWILAQYGVSNEAEAGAIPDTVRYAFYFGAVVLFLAVGWTVLRTREYSPEQLAAFEAAEKVERAPIQERAPELWLKGAVAWFLPALVGTGVIWALGLDKQLYILSISLLAFALLQAYVGQRRKAGKSHNGTDVVMADLYAMPDQMKRLALVQFFSWFALFAMWIYTTAAVTSVHYGTMDTSSAAYNEGANWVGMLFAGYNGFSAIAAMIIPMMVSAIGIRFSHSINLLLGAAGLASIMVIDDPAWLMLSMVGIGFAWASILSLPYALLAGVLPANKMGVFMGIFNLFLVIPQLLAASVLGMLLRVGFDNQPIYAMAIGAVSFGLAALSMLTVKKPEDELAAQAT